MRFLKSLAVKGCTVTADALHCRPDTAAVMREAGADDVLILKTNRPASSRRRPRPRPFSRPSCRGCPPSGAS